MTSKAGLRRLGWLYFFVADLQTGFGPFIAVYLTHHHWTQGDIGLALGMGTIAGMLAQVPAGMAVDAMHRKTVAAGVALVGICLSAMLIAISPAFWPILAAQVLHGLASSMLNPALIAVTLGMVRVAEVAERLGLNARYAAIGSAAGAVLMGASADWIAVEAVFWLASLLCVPAMFALATLRPTVVAAEEEDSPDLVRETVITVLRDRRLLAYIGCTALFHLSNAAMLPLAGQEITKRADDEAGLIVAACILVPQGLVALLSPHVGRAAEAWGRRLVLMVGFCALPARAVLLAVVDDPYWVIAVQAFDGVGAAVFGVMTPLIAADISPNRGRFNLRMGVLGLSIGLAATVGNIAAGAIAENLGVQTAFLALAAVGAAAVGWVIVMMPETRPAR